MRPRPPRCSLFPYTTLFRSDLQLAADLRPPGQIGDVAIGEVRDELVGAAAPQLEGSAEHDVAEPAHLVRAEGHGDRKSTRLNSSHLVISYAVFCLKKKQRST